MKREKREKHHEVEDTIFAMRQEEVAEALGISRARVSFLERQAMRKLRESLAKQNITLKDWLT